MKDDNPDQLDGQSQDLSSQHLEVIKAQIPSAFDLDGNLVWDKLRAILAPESHESTDDIPSFGLGWPGKQRSFAAAGVPTTATLRPNPEESIDFERTQNLLIEGDNLEVLKTLQRSYHGKIKMIYIDPPYNTGKDFVYPDNYGEGLDTYLQRTQQKDEDGFWKSTNNETSGRKHANWLSMMASRLTLARNLLRDDGVIFISIDDNEVANLRMLCDEVFGPENFLAKLIWNKQHSQQQGIYKKYHEYVLSYAKKESRIDPIGGGEGEIDAGALKKISRGNPESSFDFPAGVRFDAQEGTEITGTFGDSEKVTVINGVLRCENGVTAEPVTLAAGWTQKRQMESYFAGEDVFDTRGQKVLEFYFNSTGKLKCRKERGRITPPTILPEYGMVSESTAALNELMGQHVFDTPKPVQMLKDYSKWFASDNDLVLDFFAGSGTTGHALMAQNAEDGGNRKYICVQLPEPLDEPVTLDDGVVCETIFDLTRERLKRAGQKIKEEAGLNAESLDTGLRVFKLDGSNFTAWNSDPTTSETALLDRLDQLTDQTLPGRSETDILWEILLKMGLPLDLQLERFEVEGASFIGIGDRTKVISTETEIPTAAMEALLDQEVPPSELVVLDGAFEDDTARANIATMYKQRKDDDGKPICSLKVV